MFDPMNRERRFAFDGRLRSRITISTAIPTRPSTPISSVTRPYGVQGPISGRSAVGSTTSKYAASTSDASRMNATMTVQCAAPTTVHLSIRVCPTVSRSIVTRRVPLRPNRSGSRWPSRTTRTIRYTVRTTSTAATRVTAPATAVDTICTGPMECAFRVSRCVGPSLAL